MKSHVLWIACWLAPLVVQAQPSWQPPQTAVAPPIEVFPSVMMANLPTAQTLARGGFHYEISHRFYPPISDGYDVNFGLDGPVSMRTSLSYGVSDRLMLTLGRSNLLDNLDLQLKYRWLAFSPERFSSVIALNGGIALNTDIPAMVGRDRLDADNLQYYLQAIYNVLLFNRKLGVGLAPSYLYNSAIFSVDRQYTFTLGNYYQYYLDERWSLWLEYSPIISGYHGIIAPGEAGRSYDSLATGVSIDTGGHFFFLFITNNTRINTAQYLVGAPTDAGPDNWRTAFGITRYL